MSLTFNSDTRKKLKEVHQGQRKYKELIDNLDLTKLDNLDKQYEQIDEVKTNIDMKMTDIDGLTVSDEYSQARLAQYKIAINNIVQKDTQMLKDFKKKAEAEKKKALEAMKKALEKKKKALEKARAEAKEAKAEKKVAEEALEKAEAEKEKKMEAKKKAEAEAKKAKAKAEAKKKALEAEAKEAKAKAMARRRAEARAKEKKDAKKADPDDPDDPDDSDDSLSSVVNYVANMTQKEKEKQYAKTFVENSSKHVGNNVDDVDLNDHLSDYKHVPLTAEDQEEQDKYDGEDAPDEERVDGEKDGQIIGNERRDHWLFSQNLQEAQNLKQAEEVRKRALEALQAREEAMRQAPKEDKKPRKRRPRKNKFLVEKAEFLKENYGVRNTGVVHGLSSSDSDSDSDNDSVKPFIGKLKLRDMSDKLNKSAQTLREKVYKYEQESGSEQELKNIMELLRKIERRSMKLFKEIKRQGRQIPNMDKNKEVIQTIFAIQSSDALFRRGSQLMRQSEGKIPMKGKIIGTNKIIQQEARNIFVQWHKLLGRFYRSLNLKTATASELYVNEFGRQWYQTISGELAKKKNIKKKKNKKTFAQKISPEPEKKRPRSNDKVTRNLLKRPDTQSSDEKLIRKMKNESEEPRKEIALDTVRRNLVKELNKEDEEQDEEEEEEEPNASTSINFRF